MSKSSHKFEFPFGVCGWCGVELCGKEEAQEHIVKCPQNPLVQELATSQAEVERLRERAEAAERELDTLRNAYLQELVGGPNLPEASRELLLACERADFEGDLSEYITGDMMLAVRAALSPREPESPEPEQKEGGE